MKYIKLFENFTSDSELYYRGIKSDSREKGFRMQTWVKEKQIAERYTNQPMSRKGPKGKLLIANLNYRNPLDFSKDTEGSQIAVTELLKYFSEEEIRDVLKNCEIRDYKGGLDYVEKKGITLSYGRKKIIEKQCQAL